MLAGELTVEIIDREIAKLDATHKQACDRYNDFRQALLKSREYALQKEVYARSHQIPLPLTPGPLPNGTIRPTRDGKKTDRQIIREFLAGWTGVFTVPELVAAAQRHPDTPEAKFQQNLWSSTIFWLVRNRFLEAVQPRQGNKPGRYRVIVSPAELVAPTRRNNKNQSPVQNAVVEVIRQLPSGRFSKNAVVEAVLRDQPDRDPDVIGAVLHRLASHGICAKIAERKKEGNIYEKL